MAIVGIDRDDLQTFAVDTIDLWYSPRRQTWFVERLDAEGNQIGLSCRCADEEEAVSCITEWLRTHVGSRLSSPHGQEGEHGSSALSPPRRRAA